jgi:hypothetical protein
MDSFDGDNLLAGREMVSESFDNAPNSRVNMPKELVSGKGFLKMDQTAELHAGSKVSKTSLDNGLYDKYWRCKYPYRTG